MPARPFESTLQDLVYHVDVGIGLRLIKLLLSALGLLFLILLYTAGQFRGLRDAEAMECAQLGRNLAEHKALITQCIRPASLWLLGHRSASRDPRIRRHPDVLTPPLYPAILAAAFRIIGPATLEGNGASRAEQWVIVPLGHLFTLITAGILYALARRLFDARVATIGLWVYFLSDTVWRTSISGLSLPLVACLALAAIHGVVCAADRRAAQPDSRAWIFPFAIALGASVLAFHARYGTIALVPGLALYIGLSFGPKAWRWAAAFVVLYLLGIAPWIARNVRVSGVPFGLAPYLALNDTRLFEGDTFARTLLMPELGWSKVVPALRTKWMTQVRALYETNLRTVGDGFAICLFLTTYFHRFVRPPVRRLRWAVGLAIVVTLAGAAFFGEVSARLFYMFWPFVILYAVAFFVMLLDRLQLGLRLLQTGVTAIFVGLSALPLVFSLLPPRPGVPYPPYFPPFVSHVCKLLGPQELICTDMPWATAWYGRRDSVQLPATLNEFYEINDYHRRVSGLYFTTLTRNQPYVRSLLTGPYRTWMPILEGRIPSDFPLTEGFPLSNLDQLFLTDRARWAE